MSQYKKVVDVISRPPDQRTDFELAAILPYVRKKAHLFVNTRPDLLKDIMRNCKFGTRQRDDIIIKQGEVGDCFYVVLSGQISIYIHNQDKGDEEERKELENIVQYKDGKLDRTKLGNFALSLGEGSPVGEVALIDEAAVRTATIVADQKTDLLIIDRPLYNRCIKDMLALEFEEKKKFICNSPLFASWAPKYRKQLAMALYKESYPYESLLVRQGDRVAFAYFIIRGQVEIQIDPSTHPAQYPKIFKAANENEAEKLMRKSDKPRPPTEVNYSHHIRKRDNLKSARLCYLGMNESVGDTELTMELDTYLQTAVCKEQTEVLVLERQHYERLFVRRHPRTIDTMRQQIKMKLLTRKSLSSAKDIPFLGYLAQVIELKSRPPPPPEKERVDPTVSEAEKEFLNHRGPLIDLHGPGSVFYLIKVREQTKLKLRSKRERLVERPQAVKNVPGNVLLAAQQLLNGSNDYGGDERVTSSRGRDRVTVQPRSFRSIQNSNMDSSTENSAGDPSPDDGEEEEEELGPEYPHDDEDDSESLGQSDWQSGDGTESPEQQEARLSFLEERVRRWLKKENPKVGPKVAQLKRFALQDGEQQPHPGHWVVRRPRRHANTTSIMDTNPPTRSRTDNARAHSFNILINNSS
ncbi:uncharacterized protein [Littorina saxatilis]